VRPPLRATLSPALVRETLARALDAQGVLRTTQRLGSLDTRSRWSALLPDLRLRAARGSDQSLRLNPTVTDPYRYTSDGGTDLILEARLSWRLSGLLFGQSEVAVERIRLSSAKGRADLSQAVLKALFTWQRALLRARDPDALLDESEDAALEELEAELRLNVLTGGWFTTERALGFSTTPRSR
jgi:hypothetical protein